MRPHRLAVPTVLLMALGVLAVTLPLAAKVVKYASRSGDFLFSGDPVFLPLDDGGATQLSFNSGSGRKLIAITFSAECAVSGDPNARVAIDILVDGEVLSPTSINARFCSTTYFTQEGGDLPFASSRTVARNVGPRQHIVQVRARLGGTASQGVIGNSSLTIIN